jgi:hypothetical protein
MAELLRPLSARDYARIHYCRVSIGDELDTVEPANDNHPPATSVRNGRVPLMEERQAKRISDRHWQAIGWYLHIDMAEPWAREGVGQRNQSGVIVSFDSRNPEALWPAERAADYTLRLHKRTRSLGTLAKVVEAACVGAEMRDLAPKGIPIPQRHLAEAGRIRLAAGLEICALLAEAEQRIRPLPDYEVQAIIAKAAGSVWALASNRRMREANDNSRQAMAA